ncbi:DUF2827 family protein [Paraburkholderia silviterrae]|uniref:DUF2827 domain-containing protein n=1 Tax=Paraburkholderia silviterrae TaxID=2528715 RepID=A0A4R5LY45_9BURK|nr:DUF2827 family protein [Paraburkholderia silviterrae]TDG17230.1 DUF2827 domain-containing protein [Paraburkholderia silviterrae]
MRIGISILTHAAQDIWENGRGQNVFYLGRLLQSLPFVEEVVLLNCGDQPQLPEGAKHDGVGFRLVAPRDATDLIDVAIEMGGGLDVGWLDHLRAKGKKVVYYCCGQPYTALIEPTIFSTSGYISRFERFNEIWTLQRDRCFHPMLESLYRCPAFDVPYVWDADFLERRVATLHSEHGIEFGYRPLLRREYTFRALRVAVLEPNISVTKTCSIPMLICDSAFRANEDTVSELHLLNTIQMKDHPTFVHLANSLDLTKQGKVRFEQRHDFAGYMSQFGDAVVAHQWQHDQNTLYLDALYGGYPLIHNSQWLGSAGYYYPESDILKGAARLVEASRDHDESIDLYRRTASEFLATLNPLHAMNQTAYARSLLRLTSARER